MKSDQLTSWCSVVGIATTMELAQEEVNPDEGKAQDDQEVEDEQVEERSKGLGKGLQHEPHSCSEREIERKQVTL